MNTPSTVQLITDNDIVPTEFQNRLMMWLDVFKRGQFEIGDIANRTVVYDLEHNMYVTQDRIFKAVGKFCGKTGRTIRYYAETAAFYDDADREEFGMLPFSHFVFARSFGKAGYRQVLEMAREHVDWSEERLALYFKARELTGQELVEAGWVLPDGSIEDQSHTIDPEVAEQLIQSKQEKISEVSLISHGYHLLSNLSSLIDGVEFALNKLKLRDETRLKIGDALSEIRKSIPEIVKAAKGE